MIISMHFVRNLPHQWPPPGLHCLADYWGFAAGNQQSVMDYIPRLTFKSRAAVGDERWMGGGERERERSAVCQVDTTAVSSSPPRAGGNQAGVVSIVCSSSTQTHPESILTTPEHTRQQDLFCDGEIVAQNCRPREAKSVKKWTCHRKWLWHTDDTIKMFYWSCEQVQNRFMVMHSFISHAHTHQQQDVSGLFLNVQPYASY